MKPNVLIAGCLALLILCTCAVAGAQAAELYAEPDAELGEWSDLEVTPTAAVDPTVVDGAESSSTLMGECTTVSKLVTDEPEVLETTVGFEAHITTTDDENCLTTSATTSLYEIAVNNAKKLEGVDYLWGGKGYDLATGKYVDAETIRTGYVYWNPRKVDENGCVVGGRDTGKGVDCSGLVMWSFNKAHSATKYIDESNPVYREGAAGQWSDSKRFQQKSTSVPTRANLAVGDLLFIGTKDNKSPDHVGIYIGDGKVIHSKGSATVEIETLDDWLDLPVDSTRKYRDCFTGYGSVTTDMSPGTVPKLVTDEPEVLETTVVLKGHITNPDDNYRVCFRYHKDGEIDKKTTDVREVNPDNREYEFSISKSELSPGTYFYRAVYEDSPGPEDPHEIDADEYKSFMIPGETLKISAKIPVDLLNDIDRTVDSLDYIDNWGISKDQFKIMLAALAWGEGGSGGYAAHSTYDKLDQWHKDLPNDFRFSGGLGPFQITWTKSDEEWTTLDKLNSKKALDETIKRHKANSNGNFKNLEDVRSKLKGEWFAYKLPSEGKDAHFDDKWKEVTGTKWNDVKDTSKTTPNSPLDWKMIKESIKNDEKESEAIKDVGIKKWTISKDDKVKNYKDEVIVLDKDLRTWFVSAKLATGHSYEYYYTYDDVQKIEIWAYSNRSADDAVHDKRSIFVRTYNKPNPNGIQRIPDNNYTLTHPVFTDSLKSKNVNVILVIDRSGSMSGSPISNAKNSAKQFIALMEYGDKAGVVSFDTYARYDYRLTTLTEEEKVKEDIQKEIDSIYVSGATAIGRGLRYALDDLLNYGDPNDSWAIVLLSDGYHNSGEHPDKVIPSIKDNNIPVYTIGLGFVDEALMKRISEQTGGEYYPTPTEKDLHQIYEKIAAKVRGLGTAGEFTAKMGTGDVLSVPVKIDSSMKKAIFSTSWPGSNVDLILHRPDGSMIDPSVAASDPAIEYSSGSTYKIYKVTDPEPGTWNMNLTATDMPDGGEDVYVTVRAESTLSMSLSTDKGQYNQGEIVKIVANLSDAGTQITGADVNVNITLPYSNIEPLTLYDDGRHGDGEAQDGVYANYFTNTSLKGDYKVKATSTGSLSDGSLFTRIEEVSFEIIPGTSSISLSPESLSVDGKTGEQITKTITISTSFSSMLVSITPLLLQSEDGDVIDTGNIEVNPGFVNVSSEVPEDILVTIKIPADTTSGDYTGKIVATSTGGSDFCTINLHVTKGVTEPTSSDSSGDDSSVSTGSALAAGGGASFSFAGLPVSTITIESEADISRALIIAERVRSLPGSITPPEPETYQYLAITPYRLEDADFDEATISFHVPVGYLSAMGKETTDVALMRYVDGQWVRLKTTLIKEEGGRAYYEAATPGFSVFAIVLEKDGATVAAPVSTPAPVAAVEEEEEKDGEEPDVVEPEVSLTSTPTPAAASAATPTPKEAPVVYAPIGLVVAGLLAFALRRRE